MLEPFHNIVLLARASQPIEILFARFAWSIFRLLVPPEKRQLQLHQQTYHEHSLSLIVGLAQRFPREICQVIEGFTVKLPCHQPYRAEFQNFKISYLKSLSNENLLLSNPYKPPHGSSALPAHGPYRLELNKSESAIKFDACL